jgi:hypothetical protein
MTGCSLLLPASRCKHTGQPLQKTLAKTVAKKTPGPILEKHWGTVAKNTGNRCKKNAPLPKKRHRLEKHQSGNTLATVAPKKHQSYLERSPLNMIC